MNKTKRMKLADLIAELQRQPANAEVIIEVRCWETSADPECPDAVGELKDRSPTVWLYSANNPPVVAIRSNVNLDDM